MGKGRRIFHWILTILFLVIMLGCFSSYNVAGGIIFLVLTVIALPFGFASELKGGKRVLKWILSIVLILVSTVTFSNSKITTSQNYSQGNKVVESAVSESGSNEGISSTISSAAQTVTESVSETKETTPEITSVPDRTPALTSAPVSLQNIPAYSGNPYVVINNNEPYFSNSDLTTEEFENYSDLDSLGRCGVAYANVCEDIMPTEKRGTIGEVRPSGWHTIKYDNVDGKYLYNRCHLIGYQLSAENANPKNLITGTRYLNVTGMLPFENMVADYVKETDHHVLYRVTPVFDGNNLLASGVLMEAESVEDKGEGIKYCVYCYNVQPGITIDYATGDSSSAKQSDTETPEPVNDDEQAQDAMNAVSKVWNVSGGGLPDGVTETQINEAQNAVNALPDSNSNKANLQQMVDASRNSLRDKLTAQAQADEAARQAAQQEADRQAQQAAAEQQIAEPTQDSGQMVWISQTGSKYHSIPDCGRMNPNNAHQESEAQAIAEGYGRCSKCW